MPEKAKQKPAFNYRVTVDQIGPFKRGTVVSREEIEAAGQSVAALWDRREIAMTGEAPDSDAAEPREPADDAAQ